MGWIIVLIIVVGGVLAWKNRVMLLSRVLGQSEDRIQRQLDRRKRD